MNWFKYRLPNTDSKKNPVVSGASETLMKGLGQGFAVAPFFNPADGLFTIPCDFIPSPDDIDFSASRIPFSTDPKDYFREIEAIKSELDGKRGKTVAARVISVGKRIDINATFSALCDEYQDAFVFAFSSDVTGTWIGASPELLLRVADNEAFSVALAGTRPASPDGCDPEWDLKNSDEQKMVEEFIRKRLQEKCTEVVAGNTFTKKAGAIEHICTPISARLKQTDHSSLSDLLSALSPTPALCGSDRDSSLRIIKEYEPFDRELYGGFCGPNGIGGVTAFFVILRAAKCNPSGAAVFVGGGITPLSVAADEWNETEMKSKTIINKLKTSEQ